MRAYRNVCFTRETSKEGKVQTVEGKSRVSPPQGQPQGGLAETNQPQGVVDKTTTAWSYRLVRNAVFSVTGAFILVMGLFAWLEVFNTDNAANVTAALSSLFGIVGTLVGAYFGIKASSDAQDSSAVTAQQALRDQKETSKDTVQKTVTVASETSQKAAETSQKAAETSQKAAETVQKAKGTSPIVTLTLATLIPVAGGASLLVLRYYLRRMQDAA